MRRPSTLWALAFIPTAIVACDTTEVDPARDADQDAEQELDGGLDADRDHDALDADAEADAADADAEADADADQVVDGDPDHEACLDLVRVVLEVDMNEGRLDDNCVAIDRWRWVVADPGDRPFFVGGIHEDSPLQGPEHERLLLGEASRWTPNVIEMFDDGTQGDEVAGDGVWTRVFALPVGLRFGYKYTFGAAGDRWTGTEEWPGNQRLLEVVDVNGDGFVRRRDEFGDETTNKDQSNLYSGGTGTVTWDTDANGDGIPDPRERPLDIDNDCDLDEWLTPTATEPVDDGCG